LAKKEGMTQVYMDSGMPVSVTVLRAGPCVVTQRKTKATDGYDAIQVGLEAVKPERLVKPRRGKPYRYLREFRIPNADAFTVGQVLPVTVFQKGERVDVQGVTKGRGFQGVIKRHGKHGGPGAHGSHFHRTTGSIGMRTWPGRVLKNMKLPGQMGNVVRTIRNLQIVDVDPELHLLFVRGAVPGAPGQLVRVVCKVKGFEQRFTKAEA
ncbi:MAG: 50S ribosomal protein L3, partial [Deltaproteobacteria bacterium]|nr:50S ribosomal protein L3 [Deltaproteobacteria bacterium]